MNIGISEESLRQSAALLNCLLADEFVLYTKTRNFHWNVVSTDFGELHKLFEEQYEQLNRIVDEVAERVRQVGGTAYGTLKEYSENARLFESPGDVPMAQEMLSTLLADHESVIRTLRVDQDTANSSGDVGTNNFMVDLLERHEKTAWMLRSYISRISDRRTVARAIAGNLKKFE